MCFLILTLILRYDLASCLNQFRILHAIRQMIKTNLKFSNRIEILLKVQWLQMKITPVRATQCCNCSTILSFYSIRARIVINTSTLISQHIFWVIGATVKHRNGVEPASEGIAHTYKAPGIPAQGLLEGSRRSHHLHHHEGSRHHPTKSPPRRHPLWKGQFRWSCNSLIWL